MGVCPVAQRSGLQSILGMESVSREIDRETTESSTYVQTTEINTPLKSVKSKGVRHELTVPKTPEQNETAE